MSEPFAPTPASQISSCSGGASKADHIADYMFQCALPRLILASSSIGFKLISADFLKVVGTEFEYLNGDRIPSHQYSVTQYERDLRLGDAPRRDEHGREFARTLRRSRRTTDSELMRRHDQSLCYGCPRCLFQVSQDRASGICGRDRANVPATKYHP